MADEPKKMSFMLAMMHYFKKSDQTTADFAKEFRALTEQDKADFREMLPNVGYNIE